MPIRNVLWDSYFNEIQTNKNDFFVVLNKTISTFEILIYAYFENIEFVLSKERGSNLVHFTVM